MGGRREERLHGVLLEIHEPPTPHPLGLTVLRLHDAEPEGPPERPAVEAIFAAAGVRVVSPRTGPRFWTDRRTPDLAGGMSAEAFVRGPLPARLREMGGENAGNAITPPVIGLLGQGLGGQGVLRLALRDPVTFPAVAAIEPRLDFHKAWFEFPDLARMYDDPEQARQDTATLQVHPLRWVPHLWFACAPDDELHADGCERLRSKLGSLGIPFSCDLVTVGHGTTYVDRQLATALAFLVRGLTQHLRSLPLA